MVPSFPDKMPPISPRMVKTGGKRARIHGSSMNPHDRKETIPPARTLPRLKVRVSND